MPPVWQEAGKTPPESAGCKLMSLRYLHAYHYFIRTSV
jgi:hypothetical protein